jgi:multimeric flavodoxin WrbA
MKVIAFNGSPRRDGNTAILIKHVFSELEEHGIETELVQLADKAIHGCIACEKCGKNKDQRCAVKDDAANEYIEKMLGADGIILGSPAYFQDVTSEMKALIDRTGYVSRANGRMYKKKVGASVVAARRSGLISKRRDDHCRPGDRYRPGKGRSGEGRRGHATRQIARAEDGMGARKTARVKDNSRRNR